MKNKRLPERDGISGLTGWRGHAAYAGLKPLPCHFPGRSGLGLEAQKQALERFDSESAKCARRSDGVRRPMVRDDSAQCARAGLFPGVGLVTAFRRRTARLPRR
jgi:hypothetical protein